MKTKRNTFSAFSDDDIVNVVAAFLMHSQKSLFNNF